MQYDYTRSVNTRTGSDQIICIACTGLPTRDETAEDDPKLENYDDLQLDFWFLHSIEYFDVLINDYKHRNNTC